MSHTQAGEVGGCFTTMLTQHIDMHNNTDLKCDADHYENIFRVP